MAQTIEPDTGILSRVSAEFREMPGLQLTDAQACRLWGVDARVCAAVISALIAAGVVRRTASGKLARGEDS